MNPFSPIILLAWLNNNHFVLLMPTNYSIINNTYDKNNINKNNNKIDNKNYKVIKNLEKDSNIKEKIEQNKNIKLNNKYKNYLLNYIENDSSIYPPIKGTKYGKTKLEDILNYLISDKNKLKKKNWPKYIDEAENHNKKILQKCNDIKIVDKNTKIIRMKKGRSEEHIKYEENEIINIKNLKKEFRKASKHYTLSSNNELLYIRYITKKDPITKKNTKVKLNLKVPTVKELNLKLYELHAGQFHCNYIDVQDSFKRNNIGFYGINEIIEEYISNCPVCAHSCKTIHRLDPVRSIDIMGPNVRYEFDLSYFNEDLAEAFGTKMILSVIDAFSRKAMIYAENNKKADNLIKHILEFCMYNGFPKEFYSDNGPEFKNSKFSELCVKEGITYIHGIPYIRHSQGTVERFHYTIKKYLGKEYINNSYKKINFENISLKIINVYNNKKHRLIGMSPNDASAIKDIDTINKINELKKKEFDKINKKRTYLQKGDTCLLNPKFLLIGKNTLIPNFIKKGKIQKKIPIKIIKNTSFGYYFIKIYQNYKKGKNDIKTGDIYVSDSKLLKKINIKTWKAIVSDN